MEENVGKKKRKKEKRRWREVDGVRVGERGKLMGEGEGKKIKSSEVGRMWSEGKKDQRE